MSNDQNQTLTLRTQVGDWIESTPVTLFIIAVILINAITLGLETSVIFMQRYGHILDTLDQLILSIFVIEITLKLYAFGWRFFKSGWNVFDFLIVAIALMPSAGTFSVLRVLRILRVLRLISIVPQLRFIVESLLKALPGISSIFILLSLLYYIFAVIATQLFGPQFPEWFGTLTQSMYTLFEIMTLEGWSYMARAIMEQFPYAWLFFVLFILIATFTMLNLFVAIIVDTMQTLHEHGKVENPSEVGYHQELDQLRQQNRALQEEISALKRRLKNQKKSRR
jgi:voltage-gated sodium channel